LKEKECKNKTKMISLLSGGIDSPVATYLMLNQGIEVTALFFDNALSTDHKNKDKVINLVKQIKKVTQKPIRLFIIPHEQNQKEFIKFCNKHVTCILCKRMMFRIAEHLANIEEAVGLITGDSLGQVASQTLQNILVESLGLKLQIYRPLVGLDKLEIEAIGKEIGTYDISISPGIWCKAVPDKPTTNAALARIEKEESKIDIEKMVEYSVSKMDTILV
jgi:thiamine biosynthesis protein ThiI